ncbi:MAG: FliM/FliN family flagellar motor C-terminal domain-containing protein [Phycisphaerales bacterium]
MSPYLQRVLELEVPVIVRLAERPMSFDDVLKLVPGSIIQLAKSADADLDLFVNDRQIASGSAVKVNENFGIKLTRLGTLESRLSAATGGGASGGSGESSIEDLAEKMLSGEF